VRIRIFFTQPLPLLDIHLEEALLFLARKIISSPLPRVVTSWPEI